MFFRRVGLFKLNLMERSPMADEMINLRSLVEQSADVDLLRAMIGFPAEKLMELEVGAKTGAAYGEKNAIRLAQRNGYQGDGHERHLQERGREAVRGDRRQGEGVPQPPIEGDWPYLWIDGAPCGAGGAHELA